MCYCDPSIRTPCCGKPDCVPKDKLPKIKTEPIPKEDSLLKVESLIEEAENLSFFIQTDGITRGRPEPPKGTIVYHFPSGDIEIEFSVDGIIYRRMNNKTGKERTKIELSLEDLQEMMG